MPPYVTMSAAVGCVVSKVATGITMTAVNAMTYRPMARNRPSLNESGTFLCGHRQGPAVGNVDVDTDQARIDRRTPATTRTATYT